MQPTAQLGGIDHPLSRSAVSSEQIEALVSGSPLELLLPVGNGELTDTVTMGGKGYSVRLARTAGELQIVLSRLTPTTPVEIPVREAPRPRDVTAPSRTGVTPPPPAVPSPRPPASAPPPSSDPQSRQKTATVPTGELAAILSEARSRGATDAWLDADKPARLRKGGRVVTFGEPLERDLLDGMLSSILSAKDEAALRDSGSATLGFELPGTGRLRAHVGKRDGSLFAAVRLVATPLPSMDALGLPLDLGGVGDIPEGLVLVAAAPGHGGSTTIAALASSLAGSRSGSVVTVEKVIEAQVQGATAHVFQREIGKHTPSLREGIAAAGREGASVITVPCIDTREELFACLDAVELGAVVVLGVPVDGTGHAVEALLGLAGRHRREARTLLSRSLRVLVGVRLFPTSKPDVPHGLVPAVEMITVDADFAALVRDDRLVELPNLRERGRALGWILMEDAERSLVQAGAVTPVDADRFAPKRLEGDAARSTDQLRRVAGGGR